MPRSRIAGMAALLLVALQVAALASCRPGGPTSAPPTALPIPTRSAATATLTHIVEPTRATATPVPVSPTPSKTPTPSPTLTPAATGTGTPAGEVFAVVTRDFAYVYTGPAEVFEAVMTLTAGMAVDLTGRNESGSWFYVDLLLGQGGWIPGGSIRIEGEIEALAILEAPVIPTATSTAGFAPVMTVRDLDTLLLQGFKLYENVIITVVQVEVPESAESRNCVIIDPAGTLCGLFSVNRIGVEYRITALGDQGSFAETIYVRED